MNTISDSLRGVFSGSVRFLNHPIVKEGIKNGAGALTFAFGVVEIHDIIQIARGREISNEANAHSSKWVQVASKVIIVCAKISLILSAGVSRPGVFIISTLTGLFFTTEQLNKVFGPNTIFAINPWHPRHVVSIAAVIFAIPAVVQASYKGIKWIYTNAPTNKLQTDKWLTDTKIRAMTLFNTITSRPLLHLGNRLCRL